jgi:hypothetical protein
MTEAEAIKRIESVGLEVEPLLPHIRPNGYILIDPRRPDVNIDGSGCTLMTYFWREEWTFTIEGGDLLCYCLCVH